MEAVTANDVIVLCGETGCGKTTQVRLFARSPVCTPNPAQSIRAWESVCVCLCVRMCLRVCLCVCVHAHTGASIPYRGRLRVFSLPRALRLCGCHTTKACGCDQHSRQGCHRAGSTAGDNSRLPGTAARTHIHAQALKIRVKDMHMLYLVHNSRLPGMASEIQRRFNISLGCHAWSALPRLPT